MRLSTEGHICLALVGMVAVLPARGDINLEWRSDVQRIVVGDTVSIGCYAVSGDSQASLPLVAVDLIFAWNPPFLQLLGVDNTGGPGFQFSGLPNEPFDLNEVVPPQDGDGFYQAQANLGQSVDATPAGTLITTLRFVAIAETPGTEVVMLPAWRPEAPVVETVVWDATTPNNPVTGTLGTVTTIVVRHGDFDASGGLDLVDHADFQSCLAGPTDSAVAECRVGDFDNNGHVDLRDWAAFQAAFSG